MGRPGRAARRAIAKRKDWWIEVPNWRNVWGWGDPKIPTRARFFRRDEAEHVVAE